MMFAVAKLSYAKYTNWGVSLVVAVAMAAYARVLFTPLTAKSSSTFKVAILSGKIYAISCTGMYYVSEISTDGGEVKVIEKKDMLEACREADTQNAQ